jgi:hypothetical protein
LLAKLNPQFQAGQAMVFHCLKLLIIPKLNSSDPKLSNILQLPALMTHPLEFLSATGAGLVVFSHPQMLGEPTHGSELQVARQDGALDVVRLVLLEKVRRPQHVLHDVVFVFELHVAVQTSHWHEHQLRPVLEERLLLSTGSPGTGMGLTFLSSSSS